MLCVAPAATFAAGHRSMWRIGRKLWAVRRHTPADVLVAEELRVNRLVGHTTSEHMIVWCKGPAVAAPHGLVSLHRSAP